MREGRIGSMVMAETDPMTQVRMSPRETPWQDLVWKLVMICGISAIPQQMRLIRPRPNDTSPPRLHTQSLKYFSIQPTQAFLSSAQEGHEGDLAILSSHSLFSLLPMRDGIRSDWRKVAEGACYC